MVDKKCERLGFGVLPYFGEDVRLMKTLTHNLCVEVIATDVDLVNYVNVMVL